MPYTPINTSVYTAAYAGAIAGMAVSGWITDQVSADYALATQIAGAFAESFDILWNNAAQLNELELAAITAIVQTDFSGRGPGPFANPQFQNPNNWNQAAGACIALVLESDIFFASQGIIPPVVGGGSPLSNVRYVDGGTTTPIPAQTGAISAPFSTIQAGIDSCPAHGTLLITAGTYAEDLTIPNSLSLQAIPSAIPGIAQTNNSSLTTNQAVCQTVNITTGTVTFDNMVITEIKGADSSVAIACNNCSILGGGDGDAITNQGGGQFPRVNLSNTDVQDGVICDSIQTVNSVVNGNVTIRTPSPSNAMYQTKFPTPGTTIAGIIPGTVITVDAQTNQNIWEGGVTLSQCTPSVIGSDVTLQLQAPIPLAASGAGGFTTLLTYDASGLTNKQKLEVGIDATATDANTPTAPVVSELRANRSYYKTGGAVTLLNDSTVFTSANLQFVNSGTDLLLQGAFNAAGGHTLDYVGQLYIKVVAISP